MASTSSTTLDSKNPDLISSTMPVKRKRRQLVSCDDQMQPCGQDWIRTMFRMFKEINQMYRQLYQKSSTSSSFRLKADLAIGKLIEKARVLYGAESDNKSNVIGSASPAGSASPSNQPHVNGSVIRAAEARFVNGAMARAISNHLVQVYHDMVHVQSPIIDWTTFCASWDAAGRNSDNLSPSNECLALVIQAWGARFSDHPSIIGSSGAVLSDLRVLEGENFGQYGKKRDQFARAMLERAVNAVDTSGSLRKASGQCVAALLMLEFLLTWGDPFRNDGRHLMVASIEHLRVINDGHSEDPNEQGGSVQQKTAGGTLFWMAYTRDSISAAFSGRSTCLSDDDIAVLCEIAAMPMTTNVTQFVSSSDPVTLCGLAVVSIFRHITDMIRKFTVRIAGPLPRRRELDEAAVRELWADLELSTHYSAVFYESIRTAQWVTLPKSGVWFRDLASMRAQLCHSLHRTVMERLNSEQAAACLNVANPTAELIQYLNGLNRLKLESDEQFLIVAREMAQLVYSYGKELVFESGLSCENLPVYLDHMLSVLPWEQGGEIESWTVTAKMTEVRWLVDGLKLQGFCWPNFTRHIDAATSHIIQLKIQADIDLARSYPTPLQTHGPPEPLIYSPLEYQESIMTAGILAQQGGIPIPLEYSQQSWNSTESPNSTTSPPSFIYPNQNSQILSKSNSAEYHQFADNQQNFYDTQNSYIPRVPEYSTHIYRE